MWLRHFFLFSSCINRVDRALRYSSPVLAGASLRMPDFFTRDFFGLTRVSDEASSGRAILEMLDSLLVYSCNAAIRPWFRCCRSLSRCSRKYRFLASTAAGLTPGGGCGDRGAAASADAAGLAVGARVGSLESTEVLREDRVLSLSADSMIHGVAVAT